MYIILNWLIATLAILIASYILPGVQIESFFAAIVTALILGILNAILKPILIILTLPINLLTLGLFTLIINALLIILTSAIVPGFLISSFWWAILLGIVLGILNWALAVIFDPKK